jgi:hypothetical protein
MNPRREASERVGGRFEVLVLEPSPPAVDEAPWFADDPTDGASLPKGKPAVSPITNTELTWEQLCASEPGLTGWCTDRWLGPWPRLEPLPASFGETCGALHMLAEHVVAPARYQANGKIGLRYTRRGFGTPFFGDDKQVRVEGAELIMERGESEERAPIATIAAAAQQVGVAPGAPTDVYTPATPLEPERDLRIDERAALALGAWCGFGASVLEQLRWDFRADDPSRVQLWPEHFDLAVELGSEGGGRRAGYGLSPGDENHSEPYLYVTPWSENVSGSWWNDPYFHGASLGYAELLRAYDQRGAALAFFRRAFSELSAA